ncbi:Zap1p [Sugiyamaella lignohabitans]|uniref:Zap1p n=1 Tax=Sugiyamaella lignohabitans TaxID=796027 RepID=A0A161HHX2_9ASCO|nr:Zap1p [Sugiyamaella lignohabitans]ANB11897.1 Zap1p [Sugiyamaella lignohabitans]
MLEAFVADDIYNWISPMMEKQAKNGAGNGPLARSASSPPTSVNGFGRPPARNVDREGSEPPHHFYPKLLESSTPLSEPETVDSETADSSSTTPNCVECEHESKPNLNSQHLSDRDLNKVDEANSVTKPNLKPDLTSTEQIPLSLQTAAASANVGTLPTEVQADGSCEECQVAMKDHLLQIYDPFLDYCAECQEAEEEHQLNNRDCAVAAQPDCEECIDVEHKPPPTDSNSMINFDILPSQKRISKKAFLENQIQPKYSNSRHEKMAMTVRTENMDLNMGINGGMNMGEGSLDPSLNIQTGNGLKRRASSFERSSEDHQRRKLESLSQLYNQQQNITRQYYLMLRQAQQQYNNSQGNKNQLDGTMPNKPLPSDLDQSHVQNNVGTSHSHIQHEHGHDHSHDHTHEHSHEHGNGHSCSHCHSSGNGHHDPQHQQVSPRSLYCHWNGHEGEAQFNSELALQAHLRHHIYPQAESMSDQLECQWDSCDVSLKFVDELLEHIRTDHYNNYSQPHTDCLYDGTHIHPKANDVTISQTSSQVYPSTQTQGYKCQWSNCQYIANTSDQLGVHVLSDHINNNIPKPSQMTTEPTREDMNNFMKNNDMFQCQYQACDFQSLNFDDFTSHIKSDHLSATAPLDSFATNDMVTHSLDPSLGIPQPNNIVGTTKPVNVTTTGTNNNTVKVKTEHDETTSTKTCKWVLENGQLCSCECKNTEELSNHIIEAHVGLRKTEYVCSWQGCDRNHRPFQQRQKMVRHLQVHTNHRPYKCHICNSTFGEESVLKQHLRVHSGERPFECKICHKRFAASAALSVHLRIHTGEKPLKCKYPGCEKRFSESSNLNKHLKTHFSGSPCICPICSESFQDPDHLFKHFKTH